MKVGVKTYSMTFIEVDIRHRSNVVLHDLDLDLIFKVKIRNDNKYYFWHLDCISVTLLKINQMFSFKNSNNYCIDYINE